MAAKTSLRRLFRGLCAADPRERFEAVRALGARAEADAAEDPERPRILLQRLAWSLMDESGATGWGAPEAIGEILARLPALRPGYVGRFSQWFGHPEVYLGNPVLDAGAVWAMGRIGSAEDFPEEPFAPHFRRFLRSPDPQLRGAAAFAAGRLGYASIEGELRRALADEGECVLLVGGECRADTVGGFTRRALEELAGA